MSTKGNIHVLGIRHHGPGSARSLLAALEEIQPDVIAIEMMDDKVNMLELLTHEDIKPPVSLLLHLKNETKKNILLPFATFSPEWQAIQFAKKQETDIERIDLPYGQMALLDIGEELEKDNEDVLAQLADLAGFENVESWWDHYLEREGQPVEIFRQLQEIMTMVREVAQIRKIDQLREAYMRKRLRSLSSKYENIAVVCGAYHGPVLTNEALGEIKGDNALLKGLKTKKVACSIIPFSYKRLSRMSGYSSGVTAPLFYEMLFSEQDNIAEKWLSKAGRVLRDKGFSASVAEVMSGVQLSHQLCHLRDMHLPGLAELEQAVLSTVCHGHEERLHLIIDGAFIGLKIGYVPDELIDSPFIKDFYSKVKSYRLTKYWQTEDPDKESKVKSLDLRKPMHLNSSHFLHQLDLLDINWAVQLEQNNRALGSFHEDWRFEWDIEDEIQLHHQATLGGTVQQAAALAVMEKINSPLTLLESIYLLDKCILAEIDQPVDAILRRLNELTAASEDLHELLHSNIRLIQIAKYGSVRNTDTKAVLKISARLHAKICNQLPYSCPPMDEDASLAFFRTFSKYYQLILQAQFEGWLEEWLFSLELLQTHHPVDARVSGFALRILHDQTDLPFEDVYNELVQRLDSVYDPMPQAIWLEGFLYGGGSVLLYNEDLFQGLSKWVKNIDDTTFTMVLPILNRTFASYPGKDRQDILRKVRKLNDNQKSQSDSEDQLLTWSESALEDAINKLKLN